MTGMLRTSGYDTYAAEYAAYVAWREQTEPEGDRFGLLPHLFGVLGEVAGRQTFYIGPDGKIEDIDRKVNPANSGADIVARLKALNVPAAKGK